LLFQPSHELTVGFCYNIVKRNSLFSEHADKLWGFALRDSYLGTYQDDPNHAFVRQVSGTTLDGLFADFEELCEFRGSEDMREIVLHLVRSESLVCTKPCGEPVLHQTFNLSCDLSGSGRCLHSTVFNLGSPILSRISSDLGNSPFSIR